MAVIMSKNTLQIIDRSGNTPEFPKEQYIINPDEEMMARVPKEYWKIDGEDLREMTQIEKDEYEYTHNSRVFFISLGTLSPLVNAKDWESDPNVIINPIIPEGGIEYGKVVDNKLVAMDANERAQYDYTHKASVYLISTKEYLTNVDATLYEGVDNAIIGAVMPDMVEPRFTEISGDEIVAMAQEIIDAIKTAEAEVKAAEDAVKEAEKVEKERCKSIADDIGIIYTSSQETAFNRRLHTGESVLTDPDIMEWLADVAEIKAKYPKV